ncbi:major capsid protein P2 [Thalassotalea profundi]|uniref:Viral coat protein P2 N-terminal domain-containing protein n=1 Tax=Thalassotalea profundi TaxID=2036687 RepID=A0ABQ3IKY9_9GAMM|nr:major capsid protein P2 [Thalassotalea profundi]GHE87442.1 hypothetical protein GCM10011501_16140 [Thalassotalea profundi]
MNKSLITQALARVFTSHIKLDAATGSNYSDEWTIKLQAGMTYHRIKLVTNLLERVAIKKVTIDVNGSDAAYASGAYLEFLAKAYQKAQTTGIFVFDLSKFHYRTQAGVFQTQLVTLPSDDVTLKILFGAKGATDPATPTLRASATVSDNAQMMPRIFEPKKYESVLYASAADDIEWIFPSGSIHKKIQTIAFDETEASISKIKVKRGSITLNEWTRAELDHDLKELGGILPQADMCLVDFTVLGFGTTGMPTNDLKFELTTSAAGSIKAHIDGYEQVIFPKAEQSA